MKKETWTSLVEVEKLITLVLCLFYTGFAFGKPVSADQARLVAINHYRHYSTTGITDFSVKESLAMTYNGLITYYAINFNAGGFVLVAADDAATPILGYSYEGFVESDIANPTVKAWFDGYSQEIYEIVMASLDNAPTLPEWGDLLNGRLTKSGQGVSDVAPLISSTWDQNDWYNYYCPADAGGPGGKALSGCVATAVGMIMKYHAFPASGIGTHSYQSYKYGTLTADFGSTSYDWTNMGTNAGSGSYHAISTLLYHIGVAVDMNYGPDKSGALSESVAGAVVDYFNYNPATVNHIQKSDYTTTAWEQLLREELDQSRPIYYAGCSYEYCHAFVCDGYSLADNRFHINWGWSGLYNGYYAVGALSPLGDWFNLFNEAIIGIQPGNPNLIVRISNPLNGIMVAPGNPVDISASVCLGTASQLNLYINDQLITSVNAPALSYTWNTTGLSLGTYQAKVVAMNATETVYHSVSIGLGEWITQSSGFLVPFRGIQYVHAVNSSVAWAVGFDGLNAKNYIQEFTRTVDGGRHWNSGTIKNCSGLVPSMIFALNAETAYCQMYRQSGINLQGIYMTRDGGNSWIHQSSAYYETLGSFPNLVHFFNNTDGWAMGDPIFGHFLCHTTTNGGTTWDFVLETDLPAPVSGEKGIAGYYSAVGDHIWFGTTKGRVYRSVDKGYTWHVSATTLAGKWIDVEFADANHGLAQDRSTGSVGALSETFDGGITWTTVVTSGPVFYTDLSFIPGTGNTWVSSGSAEGAEGASWSDDGGHTWHLFSGTAGVNYLAMAWISNQCGWAGGYNDSSGKEGFFKYSGVLPAGGSLLHVKVFMEGAYYPSSDLMNLSLNTGAVIPLTQPYATTPWNYAGTENVTAVPAGVVDWILVELRDAPSPADALSSTILSGWPKACFLKNDGTIVDLDGTSFPETGTSTVAHNLFVVVRHRNHLAVIAASGATLAGGVYSYDFTSDLSQAYGGGTGYKMTGSKAVMVSGDMDHDGNIFVSDFNNWAAGFGAANGYFVTDLDMDRNVFVSDYNKWAANFGYTADDNIKSGFRKPKYFSCVPR